MPVWTHNPRAIARFSSTEKDRAWYRRVIEEMAERDRVRIAEVVEDGEAVATVLGLQFGEGSL